MIEREQQRLWQVCRAPRLGPWGAGSWVAGRDRQKVIERWHLDRPGSEAPSATCVGALLQRESI